MFQLMFIAVSLTALVCIALVANKRLTKLVKSANVKEMLEDSNKNKTTKSSK